jgi:hypothetical protein
VAASLYDALTPDTAEAVRMLVAYAAGQGITLVPSSGKRSCAEQDALYAKGPTVTKARGCNSWHVLGRAVDAYIHGGPAGREQYAMLAAYWKSIGGKWGGDFGASGPKDDLGHFEYHPGLLYAGQVCLDAGACVIDHARNAPQVYPEHPAPEVEESDSSGGGMGWLVLAGALAVGIGIYAGRSKR